MNSLDSFTLAPMSAGDIIDRAVRLYRRNFLALLRIVIAPSLVAYAGSILMSIGWRNATLSKGDARVVITFLMILGGSLLWAIGKAAFYAVLGGSSRSLVAHFFEGKPILARDVYRAVRERIWSLIGATLMTGLLILGIIVGTMMIAYFFIIIMAMIFAAMAATIFSGMPEWILGAVILSLSVITMATLAVAALMVYSRVVYVPQILMVEGKGVFNSISRSFALASGQIRRIAVLFLFWIYVGWSLIWLLFVPLGYVSDWTMPINPEAPLWYTIGWQTVTQLSEILLMPIFMIGCTLLYLDSRVRKEGFDVELLANQTLVPPPHAPPLYPLAPQHAFALEQQSTSSQGSFVPSIFGLNDYSPAPANTVPAPSVAIEPSLANGVGSAPATVATEDEDRTQEPVEFVPGGQAAITPVVQQPAIVEASPLGVSAGGVTAKVARKSCQWCDAEATVEDRFCRVCGSVF